MFIKKLLILFVFLTILSCSSKDQVSEVLVEQDLEKQMIELYAVCDKSYTILITYQELQSTNLWVTGWRTLK